MGVPPYSSTSCCCHKFLPGHQGWIVWGTSSNRAAIRRRDPRHARSRTQSARWGMRVRASSPSRRTGPETADAAIHCVTHAQRRDASRPPDVGIAVVGLGAWGPNLLRVLGDDFDAQVRWICDVDSSRLAKYRRHHPDARVTTRPETHLGRSERRRRRPGDAGGDALRAGHARACRRESTCSWRHPWRCPPSWPTTWQPRLGSGTAS